MWRERINRMENIFLLKVQFPEQTQRRILNCLVTQTPDLLRLSYWLGLFFSLQTYYLPNFLLLGRCVEEGARHGVYVKMSGISMKYIRERGCNLLFITTKFISRLALTITDYTTTQASPFNFVNGFF